MTRLLLVPGSLRAGSFNLRLLRDLAQRLHGRCEIDFLLPRQVGLPLFDQDLEAEPGVMAQVRALHRRFAAAHGLVVASPAYNGQLTPYLKNLVDWVARLPEADPTAANAFLDRPVLLCSASRGGGDDGPAAIPNARALFGHVGATVLGEAVSLPRAAEAWTADGFGFSPRVEAQLDAAVARVLRQAQAFAATAPAVPWPVAAATGSAGGPRAAEAATALWPLPQRPAAVQQATAGVA
ncbi:NADPH-dependent FMN reductase [Aquabacterium sp. OR-4]|uniref:NADPH-dependent FMN reductase n=1 Tax=Aquabacterium sp. OR-4 TaxID=2978127 RepID=UPI0021B22B46|nr:NAD(P)H-dependent oxidoreductase [Aquabacterium sp. OR-4]MDT7838123.1 NAD(P)H-dependent oxidoreductase [Aquabacterium sp. OR-4]